MLTIAHGIKHLWCQHWHEWKGLWCSSTVRLPSTLTWMEDLWCSSTVRLPSNTDKNGRVCGALVQLGCLQTLTWMNRLRAEASCWDILYICTYTCAFCYKCTHVHYIYSSTTMHWAHAFMLAVFSNNYWSVVVCITCEVSDLRAGNRSVMRWWSAMLRE